MLKSANILSFNGRISSRSRKVARVLPPFLEITTLNQPATLEIARSNILKPPLKQAPSLIAKSAVEEFYESLQADQIEIAKVNKRTKVITYQNSDDIDDEKTVTLPVDLSLIEELLAHNVQVVYEDTKDIENYVKFFTENIVTIMFVGLIAYSVLLQRAAISSQTRFFNGNKKTEISAEDIKVKFKDVAGLESAKMELMEVVEFLKTPEKFALLGAKIPKGCLLTGGPGLGKTLLAKAIAGEAGVPFFASSASEFMEMFVGVGASRIRDLFKKASEVAPCIVFIDEIDAIGKSRSGNSMMTSNDEREQTINQLLTEMDGFTPNSGVVVIAATNRPDILDKALVRPGRFDRQINLDPPSLLDREQILKIHCKSKPLDADVDLLEVAKNTVGLSGAELANITNEAAILAARRDSTLIAIKDFNDAIDRVMLGPEKKNNIISAKKKRIVACHEAGHTLTALKVGEFDTISKVSIIPRGKTGGVTVFQQLPDHVDTGLYSKKYLENKLVVALGGRAAEEIIFGEMNSTTGAYNDMEVVQQIARAMVVNYGFNAKMGPVSWATDTSSITHNQIDKEVLQLVKASYKKSKNIIENNIDAFNTLAEALYNKEVLSKDEIVNIINGVMRR